jgi:hypothetical protein
MGENKTKKRSLKKKKKFSVRLPEKTLKNVAQKKKVIFVFFRTASGQGIKIKIKLKKNWPFQGARQISFSGKD